jgi:hypothetical protein
MSDSALSAMGIMFDEVCVLVTAAFALRLQAAAAFFAIEA